jgi:hypothetical protein
VPDAPDPKLQTLRTKLAEHIEWFDGESTKHKTLYRRLRITSLSLLAASTLAAGTAASFPEWGRAFNLAVVAATAAAGLLASIEAIRRPAELWALERGTFHALCDLQDELDFRTAGNDAAPDLDDFFARMQGILRAAEQKWHLQSKSSEKRAE